MRKFQMTINMTIVDQSPPIEFSVYADSNNIWETICAGFSELLRDIQLVCGIQLPEFGRKEYYRRFSDGEV